MRVFMLCAFLVCSFRLFAQQPVDHWTALVNESSSWTYTIPSGSTSVNWKNPGFPTSGWSNGLASIGYGDGDDQSTIAAGTMSVYMRQTFTISDTSKIEEALLHVDYDDAFVAYLNGVEIARSNIGTVGVQPLFNDPAAGFHEGLLYQGMTPESFPLNKALLSTLLVNGTNVLAIEVHNESAGSSDFTALATFCVGVDDPLVHYQSIPTWFVAPLNFTSSNLPIVVINTLSQTIQDDPKITCDMGIIYNGTGIRNYMTDPFTDYNGKIGIEIRGSSSQMFPKKSYGVETRDALGFSNNVSLLGMPAENDWILYAPYTDKSLMRDVMVYQFGNDCGRYAPRTRFVELVINGEYMGVYVLEEKIKIDNGRVDIASLNPGDTLGDELTGGYILKIDKFTGGSDYFMSTYLSPTGSQIPFLYHDPEGLELHPLQQNYIQGFIQDFEDALFGPSFNDPVTGYRGYIHVGSFIDYFLANEFSRNVDGYRLSTYFYKDKNSNDSLLHIGPLWDFNLALGNADYCDGGLTTGWAYEFDLVCGGDGYQIPRWWYRLLEDTVFVNELKCRYLDLRSGILSDTYLMNQIDSMANVLDESQQRNYLKWPILGMYVWPNNYVGNSFQEEIDYLKNWVIQRMTWLDANMPGACPNLGLEDQQTFEFSIYPNPASDQVQIVLHQPAKKLSLFSISGELIIEEKVHSQQMQIDVSGLSNGVYFVVIQGDDAVSTLRFSVAH